MRHTTMYLSVRQARGWDGPVGDPFGGPAYGKREMPVIAIAASVGTFAAGAAAVAAGTATFMTGVMMVGAALTIVGTVTGNKNLTMIGGIMSLGAGLAGGLSGAAEAAGSLGAENLAGVDAAAGLNPAISPLTPGVDAAATTGDLIGAGEMAGVDAAAGLNPDVSALPQGASEVPQYSMPEVATEAPKTLEQTPLSESAKSPTDTSLSGKSSLQTGEASAFKTQAKAPWEVSEKSAFETAVEKGDEANLALTKDPGTQGYLSGQTVNYFGQARVPDPSGSGLMGYIDKFGRWVKENPKLAEMGMGVAKGLLSGESEQEKYMRARREEIERGRIMAQGKNVR